MKILVLNCGSSSIKYKLFDMTTKEVLAQGGIEKIGLVGSFLKLTLPNGEKKILEKVCPFVPEVVTSKLGADAPIIGGIKVALDYAEEQIIMLWKS